jgi:hypothetical protein
VFVQYINIPLITYCVYYEVIRINNTFYRAWNLKEKKMIYNKEELEALHNNSEYKPTYNNLISTIGYYIQDGTVDMMMYSTWQDKLSNLICDGDILYEDEPYTWYIDYNGCCFMARGENGIAIHLLQRLSQSRIKIIGNKYEGIYPHITGKERERGEKIFNKFIKFENGLVAVTSEGLRAGKKWWQL